MLRSSRHDRCTSLLMLTSMCPNRKSKTRNKCNEVKKKLVEEALVALGTCRGRIGKSWRLQFLFGVRVAPKLCPRSCVGMPSTKTRLEKTLNNFMQVMVPGQIQVEQEAEVSVHEMFRVVDARTGNAPWQSQCDWNAGSSTKYLAQVN